MGVLHMAQITLKQGQVFSSDNRSLYYISSGSITASYPGGSISLSEGDTAGLLELFAKKPLFTYQVTDNVTLSTVTINSPDVLYDFFEQNEQNRQRIFASAIQQMSSLLRRYETLFYECQTLYESLVNDYKHYIALCQKYQFQAQALIGFDKLKSPIKATYSFLSPYYEQSSLIIQQGTGFGQSYDSWLLVGLLIHCNPDAEQIINEINILSQYQTDANALYLNAECNDLISLDLTLLSRFRPDGEDTMALLSEVRFMLSNMDMLGITNKELLAERQAQYDAQENRLSGTWDSGDTAPGTNNTAADLAGSLEQILAYSEIEIEHKETLRQLLAQYAKLPDRASVDEGPRLLYKRITEKFLMLYQDIALKALKDIHIPTVIKMFLFFGYLDENLAGTDNALLLYDIASTYKKPEPDSHVYPFFFWLKAIYDGQKEPSRNEFDEEYSDVIHKMKMKGDISAAQEKALMTDNLQKVKYELGSMFPQVNKMTFGRISTYCPVFSEHNVLKDIPVALVTKEKLDAGIQKVCSADFGAYYRETIYTNPTAGVNKEFIHVEALPDFILMPNMGTRGAMWQEIENRRRTTSARMMVSILHLEDINNTIVRLSGEYRWEMCKRIQGGRWNDLTELSLTSEYFDYIQFYRKNSDLSPDAKEKVKNSLAKTKNNYKEMFVLDYAAWILYESVGSPRLNKVARNILFTYCPFPKAIRTSLETNPIYRDILDRYNIRNAQKVHHMELLRQKLTSSRGSIPEEIEQEYKFITS